MPTTASTMLKECVKHGYFRGDSCPTCGDEGRFFMDARELDHIARIVAGILRHFPDRYGLKVDPQGWVQVKYLVQAIRSQHRNYQWLKPHHIVALAMTDPKGRYELRDEAIRATYGHTVDVSLDLPTEGVPEALFYPVTPEELDIVMEVGLKPTDRKMVHLSLTAQDAFNAGRVRCDTPTILSIDTAKAKEAGHVIQKAGKTVFLVDWIPPEMISKYDGEPPHAEDEDQEN
jgi:putative RNA 2'-phosphotransferase